MQKFIALSLSDVVLIMLINVKMPTIVSPANFDNTPIQFVEDQKHLGITFSSNGQLHTHIESIADSAAKILGIMRKLKYTLSRYTSNQTYFPL